MLPSVADPDPVPTPEQPRSRAWPWVALGLALAWVVVLRVPLVLNARMHLDSDLAVDGLVLLDAAHGKFRWHYPGTPFIGSIPVALSLVPAWVVGVGPGSLVAGGVVAFGLLVGATFWLNWRAFGPSVAVWGLIPLTFASSGAIWLSGRITGGHLLTAVWHAAAFAMLAGGWRRGGGWRRASVLGLWCGLGLYLDTMFVASWAGLAAAVAVGGWWGAPRPRSARRAAASLLAFAVGAGVGVAPRFVGSAVDPRDSYVGQLQPVFDYDTVVDHNLWLLLFDCEPRLIAGHRLPGLEIETIRFPDGSRPAPRDGVGVLMPITTALALLLFAWTFIRLAGGKGGGPLRSRAIGWGLVVASLAVLAGFLVNRNITNSDNYRYLVFLLVPWSSGFGLLFARWAAGGRLARGVAVALAVGFAGLMTVDASRYYARFGWVDATGWRPVRVVPTDPALDWLNAHPEVTAIFADYWDAYRLSFLTGGRVVAVPLPVYPDRFPEVTRRFPNGRPPILIARPSAGLPELRDRPLARFRAQALAQGGREIAQGPALSVIDWPATPSPRRSAP